MTTAARARPESTDARTPKACPTLLQRSHVPLWATSPSAATMPTPATSTIATSRSDPTVHTAASVARALLLDASAVMNASGRGGHARAFPDLRIGVAGR